MPLQANVVAPAHAKIAKLAEAGHPGARELATAWARGLVAMTETGK